MATAVVPINPHEAEVEGLTCYASVLEVPGAIDMASFYVPPEIGLRVIDEVARKGIPEVWLNPGARGERVPAVAQRATCRAPTASPTSS